MGGLLCYGYTYEQVYPQAVDNFKAGSMSYYFSPR